MRNQASLAAIGTCLLLAGCATSRPAAQLALPQLPANFVAASPAQAAPVAERWWTQFDDPQLDRLVEEAVADNPAIGKALARLRQARAQARIAGADRLPQLGAGFGAARQQQSLAGLGIGLPGIDNGVDQSTFTFNTFDLTANVSWEIDMWGRLSAQSASARAEYLASAENLRAARQLIAAQTARAYFAVIEAQRQVALSQETVRSFAEASRQIGNRVEYGRAAPNDLHMTNADLRSAEAELERRRQELAQATRQLDILQRDYPDGAIDVAADLPAMPPAAPAGMPAQLLERRPDIAAAGAMLNAAGFRVKAAERSLLPAIELTAAAGTASNSLSNLFDPDFFIWSIAGRVLQPIFQGGRLRAQIELRQGERDEAIEDYADIVLTALTEVETALALDGYLANQQNALASAARDAGRSAEIAFNRYYVGSEAFLTVLESRRREYAAQSALLAVRRARLDNRIALHLALGGGFEDQPDRNSAAADRGIDGDGLSAP